MYLNNPVLIKAVFICLMGILAWVDYKRMIVPNIIVLIGIGLGLLLTDNILWAIVAGILGLIGGQFKTTCTHCGNEETYAVFKGLWGGGDVKLFAMIGAFVGVLFIPIAILGYLLAKIYRLWRHTFYEEVALTPFMLAASLIFIWI